MMNSSLESKLIDGKAAGYCSSSDDEQEQVVDDCTDSNPTIKRGGGKNTGPKGVLDDWRRYKQLQSENNARDAKELRAMAQRLSMTCRTARDDERALRNDEQMKEDDDDEFVKRYMNQRRHELMQAAAATEASASTNLVVTLNTSQSYLDAIDESKRRTVIVHIYENDVNACASVDACLQCLAKCHRYVRFYRIRAVTLQMSDRFTREALPTIQVYRDDKLIGNFIRINECMSGDDVYIDELEAFLQKLGIFDESNKTIRDDGGDESD